MVPKCHSKKLGLLAQGDNLNIGEANEGGSWVGILLEAHKELKSSLNNLLRSCGVKEVAQ